MLCGKPPFYSSDEEELKHKICSMKYDLNYKEYENVSQDAIDLLKSIFFHMDQRPSSSEILDNKWIKDNAPNSKFYPLVLIGYKYEIIVI